MRARLSFLPSFLIFALLIFLGFAVPLQVSAQFTTGPVAAGAGGAGRATIDPGEIAFLNPASVAHLQRYYIGTGYATSEHRRDGDTRRYSFLMADGSIGNLVPGSLSYVKRISDRPGVATLTEQDLAVTLGGFILNPLALGITGHRVMFSGTPGGTPEGNQDNAHIGLLFTPKPWLGIGFVAYDVLPTSDTTPLAVRLIPTYAIGAHMLFSEIFRLRADIVRPDIQRGYDGRRHDVMLGLQSDFRHDWSFQLGGQWRETADQMYVTTGFGYHGPRLSFDYSIQKDVRSDVGSRHVVDLWLPL